MSITLSSDKTIYYPGETATITLTFSSKNEDVLEYAPNGLSAMEYIVAYPSSLPMAFNAKIIKKSDGGIVEDTLATSSRSCSVTIPFSSIGYWPLGQQLLFAQILSFKTTGTPYYAKLQGNGKVASFQINIPPDALPGNYLFEMKDKVSIEGMDKWSSVFKYDTYADTTSGGSVSKINKLGGYPANLSDWVDYLSLNLVVSRPLPLKAKMFGFKHQNTDLTKLEAGTIEGWCDIENDSCSNASGQIVCVVYKKGVESTVKISPKFTLSSGQKFRQSVFVDVDSVQDCIVKLFALEDLENIRPLGTMKSIDKVGVTN